MVYKKPPQIMKNKKNNSWNVFILFKEIDIFISHDIELDNTKEDILNEKNKLGKLLSVYDIEIIKTERRQFESVFYIKSDKDNNKYVVEKIKTILLSIGERYTLGTDFVRLPINDKNPDIYISKESLCIRKKALPIHSFKGIGFWFILFCIISIILYSIINI